MQISSCRAWDSGNTIPPKMAPWRIEYFKQKELEEWYMQEGLSELSLQ